MAAPRIDWEHWSQYSIEPFMYCVIHFASGDVTITDDNIANISMSLYMFDSSYLLFGPPEPPTCSLEIVDFDQIFNPTNNSELTDNISVDFYLGLHNINYANFYVSWDFIHSLTWAQASNYTWSTINDLEPAPFSVQRYGTFLTQEWTYDTLSHTATVDLIGYTSDLLLTDNRLSGPTPTTNYDLRTFVETMLGLYASDLEVSLTTWQDVSELTWSQAASYTWASLGQYESSTSITLPYLFYEDTMAATLNNGITALYSSFVYGPDNTPHLFRLFWYSTGITLTDEDIETYEIKQSSIETYDSVDVHAQVPAKQDNVTLLSLENQEIKWPDTFEYSTPRVYQTYAVETDREDTVYYAAWNASAVNFLWRVSTAQYFMKFVVIGSTIVLTDRKSSTNVVGVTPYTLSTNGYIPSIAYAEDIMSYLTTYIFQKYFTLKVSLRGCYGLWVGAQINLYSELYGIDAPYIITQIEFNYDGAVHTELTLQRIN